MLFPLPTDENARLQTLRAFSILAMPSEDEFDDLTLLASLTCGTPIALITFLDECRQWFKAKIGVEINETPRNIAFCAYTICQPEVLIVPDAALDERFANNPLVTGEPHIRFYAGAPLINDDKTVLGTICVLDVKPRELTDEQIKCLQTLARQVITRIHLNQRTTELTEANALLSNNEEQYRFLTEAISQQVWTATPDGKLDYVNARVLEFFNAQGRNEDFFDDGWLNFVHEEDKPVSLGVWKQALETGKQSESEFRLRRFDGEYRWHLVQVKPIFDDSGILVKWFGTNTDIHDLKLVNERLFKTESYRNLFQHAGDAIFVFDPETLEIIDVNERACQVYELERANFVGQHLSVILPPNAACQAKVRELFDKGFLADFETVHQRSDGTPIQFSVSPAVIEYKGKTAVLSINRDITERVRMENDLRQSAAEMQAIFAAMSDVILVVDENCCFQKIAPTNPKLLFKPIEELAGKHVSEVFPPDKAAFFADSIKQALSLNKPISVEYDLEIDNKNLWFSAIASPLNETSVMWVARDITERKEAEAERLRLEAQLQQAQKMESIGTLAGGVAHDFNNLLTVIISNIELLQIQVRNNRLNNLNAAKRLTDIETAASRAAALTRQLLAFSRRQQLERKSININDVVTNILKLLERLIGTDIEISLNLAPDLQMIYADVTQIEQVIMNLVVNARDAMPDGGKILIHTRVSDLSQLSFEISEHFKSIIYVQLSLTDSGFGMDDAVKKRVFEPFFTTKEVGKGTGLGLAMSYGIVKQHNGFIDVKSSPNSGTTFEIYFPVVDFTENLAQPENFVHLRGGAETVLVAEDEDMLRELTCEMLSNLGYKTLTARNGLEAVQLFENHQSQINLVLLDLVMPHLNGSKVYQHIRVINPIIPVIFTTGYGDKRYLTDFSIEAEQEKVQNIGFLPKPYNLQILDAKVREILDK